MFPPLYSLSRMSRECCLDSSDVSRTGQYVAGAKWSSLERTGVVKISLVATNDISRVHLS